MLLDSTVVKIELTVEDVCWLGDFLSEAFSDGGWSEGAYAAEKRIRDAIDASLKRGEPE